MLLGKYCNVLCTSILRIYSVYIYNFCISLVLKLIVPPPDDTIFSLSSHYKILLAILLFYVHNYQILVWIHFIIARTRLYNFGLLKPLVYILKLWFIGYTLFFLFCLKKHRLWVLIRTASARRF